MTEEQKKKELELF